MQQIEQLYHNDFGVAFYWIKDQQTLRHKVQLVFKETGFYLTREQMQEFSELIDLSCQSTCCSDCEMRGRCHKFLLKTPFEALDLAVTRKEVYQIKDLVEGTLFQLDLNTYLDELCKN